MFYNSSGNFYDHSIFMCPFRLKTSFQKHSRRLSIPSDLGPLACTDFPQLPIPPEFFFPNLQVKSSSTSQWIVHLESWYSQIHSRPAGEKQTNPECQVSRFKTKIRKNTAVLKRDPTLLKQSAVLSNVSIQKWKSCKMFFKQLQYIPHTKGDVHKPLPPRCWELPEGGLGAPDWGRL